MSKRPEGPTYRNLTLRGGTIQYERLWQGYRYRKSLGTLDWDEAAGIRDGYEAARGIGFDSAPVVAVVPTFAEFAPDWLDHRKAAGDRYASTADWERMLDREGRLMRWFGHLPLDEIELRHVAEFWFREIDVPGRAKTTGLNHVNLLSSVLKRARVQGILARGWVNPVTEFRETELRDWSRTKQARALAERAAQRGRPLLSADELYTFVTASRAEYDRCAPLSRTRRRRGTVGHVVDMLGLDAGLRIREASGLTWGAINFGEGPLSTGRSLTVCLTRTGGRISTTKSGRSREVALSLRLRALLLEFRMLQGNPGPDEFVTGARFHEGNHLRRHLQPLCETAKLGRRGTHDLRRTFASQLLSAGADPFWVYSAMGHADGATTLRHYATMVGPDSQRLDLADGEVWPDLLARIQAGAEAAKEARNAESSWR